MKKKANIYDADDVERSKRLNFTPEERAARAEHKAARSWKRRKRKCLRRKSCACKKNLIPKKAS